MARCLILGCGCRGRVLAGALRDRGHVVRGTTRDPAMLGAIEAAGAEAVLADPDRLASVIPALDHVAVLVLALGSATGSPSALRSLHGERLESLLARLLDTTVRGVVYEAGGTVPESVLRGGADMVARLCAVSRVPHALVGEIADGSWTEAMLEAVDRVLAPAFAGGAGSAAPNPHAV